MKEIESLFDAYKMAVLEKDVLAYSALFDEDLLVFDMWADWSSKGLAGWREMAKGWFGSLGPERVMVSFDEVQILSNGEFGSATAFARFAAVSESGQELRYLENRLTWVVQKKKGVWKIVHQHTSVPIAFEGLKGILQK